MALIKSTLGDDTEPRDTHARSLVVSTSRLEGVVDISGAKNSVLKLLSASLLTSSTVKILRFPASLRDVQVHIGMLEALGKKVVLEGASATISESRSPPATLDWAGRSIRNTLLILGALVARGGEGRVPLPGGCAIGDRKFDIHELVLKALGAEVWIDGDSICAVARGHLLGADIHLPIRSTGATENGIICGALARGVTRIWNPHIRPEVLDLVRFLRGMGARITVHGQEHIEVHGVEGLDGITHLPIADNMEALTWLIGAVITKGQIEIRGFPWRDLEVPLIFLRESGAKYYHAPDHALVVGGTPYPVDISTGPYPGINSDMQPLFAVFGACANGQSHIVDLRFPGRYRYVEELQKLGVRYAIEGNFLRIDGGHPMIGGAVKAIDLRAGAALMLAGLVASGTTVIADAWQIERGYNDLEAKLLAMNARAHYA